MPEKKGKAGNPDDIMSPADMKPILAHAKHAGPVSCVIALTQDKDGVILLDKRKKPKQLLAELKKQAAGAGLDLEKPTLRFGRARVDTEQEAGLLTFVVNKETNSAMRLKLLERVKKVGFSKVEIIVDKALDEEPEEDQADPPAATGAVSQPSAVTQSSALPDPGAAPSVPPQPASPGQDATVVTRALTDLVRQMVAVIAADPTRGNALKELATQAQSSLKTGDIAGAARSVQELRRALDGAGAQPAAAPPAAAPPAAAPQPLPPSRGGHAPAALRASAGCGRAHAPRRRPGTAIDAGGPGDPGCPEGARRAGAVGSEVGRSGHRRAPERSAQRRARSHAGGATRHTRTAGRRGRDGCQERHQRKSAARLGCNATEGRR